MSIQDGRLGLQLASRLGLLFMSIQDGRLGLRPASRVRAIIHELGFGPTLPLRVQTRFPVMTRFAGPASFQIHA